MLQSNLFVLCYDFKQILHSTLYSRDVMTHMSILPQLLQKVDIDLRTAVDCVNNLQSLLKSCRDVSKNDTCNEIYQNAADMVSPDEIAGHVL